MTTASFNMFDAIVLGIFLLSATVAFFRGFLREILSLGAWLGAAVITIYLFPHTAGIMKSHMKSEHLAGGAAALSTYIAALIVISLINSVIIRYVKTGAEVGLLDNFLGLGFGALRGAFALSLGYLIMVAVVPKNPAPEWLRTSAAREYLQQGADMLIVAAPQYLNDMEDLVKQGKETVEKNQAGKKQADDQGDTKNNEYKLEGLKEHNQQMNDSLSLPQGTDAPRVP